MSRIPEDEILRLKKEVPLVELCHQRNIELKAQGTNFAACCPFHDDTTPSFIITPSRNLWHCFGACGKGGSNIDFIQQMEKTDFRGAIEILRKHNTLSATTFTTRAGNERAILIDPEQEHSDVELLGRVADFYHQTFMNRPQAMQYLQGRGCFHPEAVTKFKLGFGNRLLGYRVPTTTEAGKKLRAHLQKLGVLRPETAHEHMSGCVIFPIINEQGQVVEMYGRRIQKVVKNAPEHLYLSGPHAGVWNREELINSRQWLLCEAAIDALSLWCHGFRNVTWSYGVNGFTPDHWKLLRQHKPDRIFICYDNDEAGNKAANELAQQLEPEGVEAWRVELRTKSDVNDIARKHQNPKTEFASLLAAATRLLPAPQFKVEDENRVVKKESNPAQNGVLSVKASIESIPPLVVLANSGQAFKLSEDGSQADMSMGERQWRVRGLDKNTTFDHLKINVRLCYRGKFHLDTFDLYNARQRVAFIAQAEQVTSAEKTSLESDLTQLIVQLEEHQEKKILGQLKVTLPEKVLSPEDEMKALNLLREPKLFERILADFTSVGTVGEDSNKLLGYLIAVSRKLDDPLSGLIVSRSAAGKSSLLNAVLDFVPEEEKQLVTSMTTQALYYLPEDGLKHKVLAVVEDEGSQTASYPLKILQSEKKLVLAVTVRDPDGGMPETKLKTVEGPVAQFMTSTQAEFDEELANRYLVLSVDEDREQTRRIHAAQREAETLSGMLRKLDQEEILRIHHNAQRLLRPLRVINPFADRLTFPDDQLRLRRDHKKYLGLIKTIAFLRQYQKPVKSCGHRDKVIQYIEVDEEDLSLAHDLAVKVLGRSLDELSPPTRSFLLALERMLDEIQQKRGISREKIRFTRREVREHLKWSEPQVRRHLDKLLQLEYVVCHRVPGLATRFHYELLYDGQGKNGLPFLMGLHGSFDKTQDRSSHKNGNRHE